MDSNQVKATVCVLKVPRCFGPRCFVVWEGFEFVAFYKNCMICISHSSDTHPLTHIPPLELCKELMVRIAPNVAYVPSPWGLVSGLWHSPGINKNPVSKLGACTHKFQMVGYQHTPLKSLFLAFKDGGCPEPPHNPSAIWEQAASALRIQQQVQPTRLNLALGGCKNKPTWEQSSLLAQYRMETDFSKVSYCLSKSFVHFFSLLFLGMLIVCELLWVIPSYEHWLPCFRLPSYI